MIQRLAILAFLLIRMGASQAPARYFELRLPDFFDHSFPDSGAIVDLPSGKPLKSMTILIRRAYEREINPNSVAIFINGKGMGNVFEQRATAEGTVLAMSGFSLSMRPDQPLDPLFEYAVEVSAKGRAGGFYYQNWLLRENGQFQNRHFAYTATAQTNDRSAAPDILLSEPLQPPIIRLSDRQPVSLRVAGTVSPSDAKITVQGRPIALSLKAGSFETTLAVHRETRTVPVEAVATNGTRRTVVIPVHVEQPPAKRVRFSGKRVAALVGISEYGSGKNTLPRLTAAATDAQLLGEALVEEAGFTRQNVRVLSNQDASKDGIRLGLSEMGGLAGPDDLFLVYVAAHALHDPTRPDQIYLAPHAAQPSALSSTAISFSELQLILDRSTRSRNVVLLFDTSHPLGDDVPLPGRNLAGNHLLNLFNDETRTVMVAAATGQMSQTRSQQSAAGLFAVSIATAIKGKADLNSDRVVTSEELCRFVAEQVRQATNGEQTPRFRVARGASSPIVELTPALVR